MKSKNNSLLGNIKYIICESMLKYKGWIILFSAIIILTNLYSSLYVSILSKMIIDAFAYKTELFNICFIIVIIFIIAVICKCLNSYFNSRYDVLQTQISNLFIENRIHKAMTDNYELLEQKDVLDMMDKAEDATLGEQNCVKVTLNCFLKIVSCLTVIAASAYLFAGVGFVIPIILFVTSAVHFIIINHFKKIDKKNVWNCMPPIDRRLGYLERISSQYAFGKEIRIFSLYDWITGKLKNAQEDKYNLQKKSKKYWLKSSAADSSVIFLQQAAVYALLIYYYINGQIQIGDLSMYISLCIVVYNSLSGILDNMAELKNTSRLVDDYRSFMSISDISNTACNSKSQANIINNPKISIEFKNVSFKYPGSEQYSLRNINITIKPKNRLAVVGSNGAGKSTFIKLLCGLYTPTEGEILINGCNISSVSKEAYYKLISPVFQNINMFALSLKKNVALGCDENIDDKRVVECLRKAGLYDKLTNLPNGINTELTKIFSDDGADLSGGEKQKLAIARALYKDSKIVILDEPTAALDALAEKALYESFDDITKDKIAVFVSHRLSSTRFCDDIIFIENGEIIEYGTHEELMQKSGKYTEMFEKQAYYYKQ